MQSILNSTEFIRAIEERDLISLSRIPKTDFHNHGCLGFSLDKLRARTPWQIPDPPYVMHTFAEFIDYLKENVQTLLYSHDGFILSIADTLDAAQADSVTELEISVDCQIFPEFNNVSEVVDVLRRLQTQFPDVHMRPEVGVNREYDEKRIEEWVLPFVDTGFFHAVDLYGNELFGEPEGFVGLFEFARRKGMRLKAHAGEYRDAEFVRRSVEVLALDEVQHGISAVQSPAVMKWLADHKIRLNVCPTSNLRLARIAKMSAHPIRELMDAGIHVTINTDDLLVFDQTASQEYLNLYTAGVLSARELNEIRVRAFRN